MKKIIILFILYFMTFQISSAEIINTYNLKTKNMYLLEMDSPVSGFNISDKDIINITPITSINSNRQQLFIETNKKGICDVIIKTDNNTHNIRFISGPIFQDNSDRIVQIDEPELNKTGRE